MLTLNSEGASYRTKLMERAQADRFAKCLESNERFTSVEVAESRRSPGKFLVSFAPANPERRIDMLVREQGKREERAAAQEDDYLVAIDPSARFYWVMKLSTGSVYQCSPGRSCDCGDATWRTNGTAVYCKHDSIVCRKQRRGEVLAFDADAQTAFCGRPQAI